MKIIVKKGENVSVDHEDGNTIIKTDGVVEIVNESEFENPGEEVGSYDISLDFDGVIHSYTSGFHGYGNIMDPPCEGAIEFMKDLFENDMKTAIMSTRATVQEGVDAIRKWLLENGLTEEEVSNIKITNQKIHANLYLDDRAINFSRVFPSIKFVQDFRPWNKVDTYILPVDVHVNRLVQEIDTGILYAIRQIRTGSSLEDVYICLKAKESCDVEWFNYTIFEKRFKTTGNIGALS